jgi:tRNA (mo5U34)-methyltransferase
MDTAALQAEIDQIEWYHEFDFGNGLRAHSNAEDTEKHRRLWGFIQGRLDAIDFRGKAVLDIGCWDGYWSFYAERRGAKSVLASDDPSQNWAGSRGLLLARKLLRSNIEVNLNLSVYELTSLGRKFDIILCLGVHYHLLDPFYAFAQVRQCCHASSVVVFEGDVGRYMSHEEARYDFDGPDRAMFVPSEGAFRQMLGAAYFRVEDLTYLNPVPDPPGGLRRLVHRLRHGTLPPPRRQALDNWVDRAFTVCVPFEGINGLHYYKPPFGLGAYDDRYRDGLVPRTA